jgi:hypothetical protein
LGVNDDVAQACSSAAYCKETKDDCQRYVENDLETVHPCAIDLRVSTCRSQHAKHAMSRLLKRKSISKEVIDIYPIYDHNNNKTGRELLATFGRSPFQAINRAKR